MSTDVMPADTRVQRWDSGTTGMLLLVGLWTVIGTVAATTAYIALGGSTFGEWAGILGYMLSYFYAWAAISLAIYWLARRGGARETSLPLQALQHFGLLCLVSVTLPFVLHPVTWANWLYGKHAVGFHSLNAFIYSFVLSGSMLVNYYLLSRANEAAAQAARLRQLELERSLEQSRMEALRAQVNPHFLFNALNSVASLVESSSNHEAYELIEQIAQLLRSALDFSRDSLVTVAEEIRFLESYLAIEKVRYAERLNVTLAVPASCLDYDLPTFSLQPLVENVIKHAVAKTGEPVHVELSVACAQDTLTLRVIDDGPGFHDAPQEGVGLGNIRKRLEYLFGDEASLLIGNGEAGGAEVSLLLPAQSTVATAGAATSVHKEKRRQANKRFLAGHRYV